MKKVERYFYPAIFIYEPGQEIAVDFPDLGCATSGTTDDDAFLSAREVLGCVLNGLEEDGADIPDQLNGLRISGNIHHLLRSSTQLIHAE